MKKLNIGVYGGTGYTGGELCRLLLNHKNVEKIYPSSRADENFDRIHPHLKDSGLFFVKPKKLEELAGELDVVFFCLPSGQAMSLASHFLNKETKVIDLGPDFRLRKETYKNVYGREHIHPELLDEAVYGITEFNKVDISNARLIANPGCYVITTILGLYPLIKESMIELSNIPVNAINGTTGGSGIEHTEISGSILSYNMEGHRHSSELEEKIKFFSEEKRGIMVNFNAAHGDFTRGIHSVASPLAKTEYRSKITREQLLSMYQEYYQGEYFVRINDFTKSQEEKTSKIYDVYPQIRNIRGTNFCDISLDYDIERGIIKVISVADNLNKGSAGSAIQNMNVMFGFNETEGLTGYAP